MERSMKREPSTVTHSGPRTHEELCEMVSLKNKTCSKCKTGKATTWWTGDEGVMGFIHGMGVPYCDRCVTEEQLEYARKIAATIPTLEAKLKSLIEADHDF
jgi:hypothetical protein